MIRNTFINLWTSYVFDMMEILLDEYNQQNERSQSFEDFVVDRVSCDLSDKGFSEDTIGELIGDNIVSKNSITIDTQYLFVAYALSLQKEYYSEEDLLALMSECDSCELDEIEDEDVKKIWEKSKNLE